MKLELSNPSVFKEAFDCISHIVDEVKMEFDKEGLKVNALDKSHVSFVSLDLKYHLFDEYECETPTSVIIDTDQFMKILKRCKNNDILKLSLDEGNIILVFEGDASRKYNIRLIDSEYESPQPPMVPHPVSIDVPSNLMKDSLGDLKLFSQNLELMVDEDYFFLRNDGTFGDSEIKYLHGDQVMEVVKARFSIEKLEEIFRASKFSETCTISIGNDLPLSVKFNLVTGDGMLGFLLAPRLNEEDY